MSYRDLPDPGLIIGHGLSALARGFAAIAEAAIEQQRATSRRNTLSHYAHQHKALDLHIAHYLRCRLPGCSAGTKRVSFDTDTIIGARWRGQYRQIVVSDLALEAASDVPEELFAVLDRLVDQFPPL